MGFGFLFAGFAALVAYGVSMAARGAIVDPTGTWLGPWPLDGARDCRTKILPGGRFEMECRADEVYAGLGRWRHDVTQITFEFDTFIRDGRAIKPAPTVDMRIRGGGNTIYLGLPPDQGEPYVWRKPRL